MPQSEVANVRLPVDFIDRLRAEAKSSGRTFSDVLRSYVNDSAVKPLNQATPRKRPQLTHPKRANSQHLAALWLVFRAIEGFRHDLARLPDDVDQWAISRIESKLTALMVSVDELRKRETDVTC